MLEVIQDTLLDTIKLLPFLFVAFLIIEFIEHKLSNKQENIISKSGKLGPIVGALFRSRSAMWIFSFSNKSICY